MTTTMTNPTTDTFRIETRHLAEFNARIAKVAARAQKLGLDPITAEIVGTDRVEYTDERTLAHVVINYTEVRISGETPVLPGGWQFLGAIEHDTMGNGLSLVHGDDPVLEGFRYMGASCEHCGFNRNRKSTVILRSEAGTVIQVGSTCLKDFLGYHGTVDSLVRFLEGDVRDLTDEDSYGKGSGYDDVPLSIFMAATAAAIRTYGWNAKSSYQGIPTVTIVQAYLGIIRLGKHDEELKDLVAKVANIADDKALAEATVSYYRNLDTTESFDLNVKAILTNEYVSTKHMGIAAYSVQGYLKSIERAAAREVAAEQRSASEWVGTVGTRQVFTAKVVNKRYFDSDYGGKFLVTMVDADDNTLKTWASGSFGDTALIGNTYEFKATVKEHGTYNEAKETTVTRVTVTKEVAA